MLIPRTAAPSPSRAPGQTAIKGIGLDLPAMATLVYFAVNLASAGPQIEGVSRSTVVLFGVAAFSSILVGTFALFLRNCLARGVFTLGPEGRRTTKVLGIWIAATLLSLVVGFATNNDPNYLAGDAYKFLQGAILFWLCYFTFRQRRRSDLFLQALVGITAILLVKDFIANWMALGTGTRLTGGWGIFAPFMLAIQFFFVQRPSGSGARLLRSIPMCLIAFALVASQWRGPILIGLAGIALLWLMPQQEGHRNARTLILPGLLFACAAFVIVYWLPTPLAVSAQATLERFRAAAQLTGSAGSDPYLARILGSRISEAVDVWGEFQLHPWHAFLGFGMGSELDTFYGVSLQMGRTHYIHLGWTEIPFRSGLVGLGTFLILYLYFLRLAYRARTKVWVGKLALVLAVQHGLSFLIASPFVSDTVVFAVYGITAAEMESAQAQRQGPVESQKFAPARKGAASV